MNRHWAAVGRWAVLWALLATLTVQVVGDAGVEDETDEETVVTETVAAAASENSTSQEARQLPDILQDGLSNAGGRVGFRLKLIFPLILAIAARLGSLVPIGLSVLGGVAVMAAFAKKAFVVSLITLALFLWEKWVAKANQSKHRPHVRHVVVPSPTAAAWAASSQHSHVWPSLAPPPPPPHREHHRPPPHHQHHHDSHEAHDGPWDSGEHLYSNEGFGGGNLLVHHGDHDHFLHEGNGLHPQRQPPPPGFHQARFHPPQFVPPPPLPVYTPPRATTPPAPPPTAGGRKARTAPRANAPRANAPRANANDPATAPTTAKPRSSTEPITYAFPTSTAAPAPALSSPTPGGSPAPAPLRASHKNGWSPQVLPVYSAAGRGGASVWRRSGEPWTPLRAGDDAQRRR